jgi:hypothetical protein
MPAVGMLDSLAAQGKLSKPVCMGRGSGHFWFPALHPMASGHRLCLVPTVSDEAHGQWHARLLRQAPGERQWRDEGSIMLAWASLRVAPDQLLLLPFNLSAASTPRAAQGMASCVTLDHRGGLRVQARQVRYRALPCDFPCHENGCLALVSSGDAVLRLDDGRWLTTLYGRPCGEKKYLNMAVVSDDGYDWRFLSLIASANDVADDSDGFEGPCESATTQLNDGRLLCIYRVGSGAEHTYFRSISIDQGRSWEKPQKMPGMGSVKPQVLRMRSGRFLLSGGRPGLFLWSSEDGLNWQSFDLLQHHNHHVQAADRFSPVALEDPEDRTKMLPPSTCYTSMCLDPKGNAVLAYDRLGNGWKGSPGSAGQEDAVFCVTLSAF